MSQAAGPEFGRLRSFLFPVHRHEMYKLVPMFIMAFFVCFNYNILHNIKDAVVIPASGAEVIPFIKVWVMLPTAILLTIIFTKLSNHFSQERVFYIIISCFLVCYALFAFVAYPLRETLHPYETAAALEQSLPAGFKGLVAMFRNWTFTAFYVACELWSSMVMTVLFWGFANEVTRIHEASRFYSMFSIGANFAAIIAGQMVIFCSQNIYNPSIPLGTDAWEQTLQILTLIVLAFGFATMLLFRWMNCYVFNTPEFDGLHVIRENKPVVKKKASIKDSFTYISKSKYLLCIAILVIGYNLVINMVEVVWKDQLRALHPLPSDYNNYINQLTSITGIVSCLTALFMAKLIDRYGWTKTALITPMIMAITCVGFFGFLFFRESLVDIAVVFGTTTPLAIAVFFGSAQNSLSRAAKYSVFDATKEMAFIPLDHETKLKGKAAIDGVGSRLGKSGGSLIHQGLLMIFTTVSISAPYVASILMVVIVLWIVAIRSLGRQFNALTGIQEPVAPVIAEEKLQTLHA